MSDAPSYLGLLNGISLAESSAHCWFTAWIEKTPSADVRRVLQTVAAREGEHGLAFAKRINELGFEVKRKDDPKAAEMLAIASSDCSDIEKFEALGLCDLEHSVLSFFDDVFRDHSIDIRTGELLGRYIAEEHDTARLLSACYSQLKRASSSSGTAVDELSAKVDALQAVVEELRDAIMRSAPPAGNGKNGRVKSKTAAHT